MVHRALILISCLSISCQPKGQQQPSSASGAAENSPCSAQPVPTLSPTSGQLRFSVESSIDPCTVKAYIVGYKDELQAVYVGNREYVLANVPAGDHDLIVTGSIVNSGASLGLAANNDDGSKTGTNNRADDGKRGKRFGTKKSLTGIETKIGEVALEGLSTVNGTVNLLTKGSYAGIDVYIPGTGYIAKTDENGKFSFTGVPGGVHDVFFDFDGFHRGSIRSTSIPSGQIYQLDLVTLVQSTGADGFVMMSGGAATSNSRTVPLVIGATDDAILMKLSEDLSFLGTKWVPVSSAYSYKFPTPGMKRLYIKFADKNGLESSPFFTGIVVKIFPDSLGAISLSGKDNFSSVRTIAINTQVPANAVEMNICESPDFTGCQWSPVTNRSEYRPLTDGVKTIYVKYRDADGFESSVVHSNITVDTTAPTFSISHNFDGRSETISLNIQANDLSDLSVKLAPPDSFNNASWTNFSSPQVVPYTPNLKVQMRDSLGHMSDVISTEIKYTPSLSVNRSNITATSLGQSAYFAGGYASQLTDRVDIYNSSTNLWSVATLSVPRYYLASASLNGIAVFAGGSASSGRSSAVDIFTAANNSWSTTSLSQPRAMLAAAAAGTKIAFAGGVTTGDFASNIVDILDTSTNTWTTANLSTPRYNLQAASVGTKILFAGGIENSGQSSNIVDIFDTSNNTWSVSSLSQARRALSATSNGTKVFFAGGNTGAGYSNVVDVFDASTSQWSTMQLSIGRQELAAVTVGSKSIFGGGFASTGVSNAVDIYDSSTNTWTTANLPQAILYVSATALSSKAIFTGGDGSSGPSPVAVYDSSTGQFSSQL